MLTYTTSARSQFGSFGQQVDRQSRPTKGANDVARLFLSEKSNEF